MIHYITRSEYGVTLRRIPETYSSNMLYVGLLFIPILFGMQYLYPWTDQALLAKDQLIADKTPYLNTTFFIIPKRGFISEYGVSWGTDSTPMQPILTKPVDLSLDAAQRKVSAPGFFFIFGFTTAFASFDWMMSVGSGLVFHHVWRLSVLP